MNKNARPIGAIVTPRSIQFDADGVTVQGEGQNGERVRRAFQHRNRERVVNACVGRDNRFRTATI